MLVGYQSGTVARPAANKGSTTSRPARRRSALAPLAYLLDQPSLSTLWLLLGARGGPNPPRNAPKAHGSGVASPQGPTGRWRVLLVSFRLQRTPGHPLPPTPTAWPAKATTVPGVRDPQGRALRLSMGPPACGGREWCSLFEDLPIFFFLPSRFR